MKKCIKTCLLCMISILAIFICLSVNDISSRASVSNGTGDYEITTTDTVYMVNPLYAGIVSEADLNRGTERTITPQILAEANKCTNTEEMAAVLRSALVKRTESVYVYYELPGTSYTAKELINMENAVLEAAVAHTGNGNEGDYLKWGYSGIGMQVSYGKATGNTVGTFSYYLTYYTNENQEGQVTTKVNQISNKLGLKSKNDPAKILAVYEYICDNVKYDNGKSTIKYSCYGAAINNSAVCQGYSLLAYRLLNDAGVDCRIIAGNTSSGSHGWNIAKIGGVYYNLDTTWDAGSSSDQYKYFLRSEAGFFGHTRCNEYSTAAFNAVYPMSTVDYQTDSLLASSLKSLKFKENSLTLNVGDSDKPEISIKPSKAKVELKFTSSNKKVAKVDSDGKITALKAGTCEITVSTSDGALSDKCYVTVKNGKKVAVKSIKLNKKKLNLKVGKKYTLKVTFKPAAASNTKLKWKSSNKKIASVSKSGVVKAKKKGTCIITVTTSDGKKSVTCKVKVK